MNQQLDDIYRELILDHYEHPRNCHPMAGADSAEDGHNPVCGDHVEIQLKVDGDALADVSVCTRGCAICTASGSIMSGIIKGRPLAEVAALIEAAKGHLKGETELPETYRHRDLMALQGVRKFPVRIKCALLPWTTLKLALDQLKKS